MKTTNKQTTEYLKKLEKLGRKPVNEAYTFGTVRNATPEKSKKVSK